LTPGGDRLRLGITLRRLVVFLAAISFGGSALAADMAVKAPLPAPAPAYSWTGFYVGGNAGYGWKGDPAVGFAPNDTLTLLSTCGVGNCPPSALFGIGGALGGVQAGYNLQVNPNWLVGFETDFDWSKVDGTGMSDILFSGVPGNLQASENVKWFGTVRARAGYLVTNKLLLYGTGGFAYGRVEESGALNFNATGVSAIGHGFGFNCGAGLGTNCFVGNSTRTVTGYAYGAGAEYALWNNVSLKAEYLYVNLGRGNTMNIVAQNGNGAIPASFTATYSGGAFQLVRGGLNWKF
jgi:outer membrane immunogenic protein